MEPVAGPEQRKASGCVKICVDFFELRKSMPRLVMFDLVTWSCRDLLRVVELDAVGRSPLRIV